MRNERSPRHLGLAQLPGGPRCAICGNASAAEMCAWCHAVRALVKEQRATGTELHLVVDGSHRERWGGAGLVLVAGSVQGEALAHCGCKFACRGAADAEIAAVERGRLWAPGVQTWTDVSHNVEFLVARWPGAPVRFLPPELRQPNHALAHRLSRVSRLEIEIEDSEDRP